MKSQISLFATAETVKDSWAYCKDETPIWCTLEKVLNTIPNEDCELLPGVKWGNYAQLYTPAFWKVQYALTDFSIGETSHRLADTIIEEIVMCILGGYGIPSEIGILAFNRMKERNLIRSNIEFTDVFNSLSTPFSVACGKTIKYRFFNQKSIYVYKFLSRDDLERIPQNDDFSLRNWLLSIDGIGLKTASWITRNWLNSERVAILDIHLLRAGKLAGLFESDTLSNYLKQEKIYLDFCHALDVSPANMDSMIWRYMKNNSKLAIKTIISQH